MNSINDMIKQAKDSAVGPADSKGGSASVEIAQGRLVCFASFFRSNYGRRPNWKVGFRLNGKVIAKAKVKELFA